MQESRVYVSHVENVEITRFRSKWDGGTRVASLHWKRSHKTKNTASFSEDRFVLLLRHGLRPFLVAFLSLPFVFSFPFHPHPSFLPFNLNSVLLFLFSLFSFEYVPVGDPQQKQSEDHYLFLPSCPSLLSCSVALPLLFLFTQILTCLLGARKRSWKTKTEATPIIPLPLSYFHYPTKSQ